MDNDTYKVTMTFEDVAITLYVRCYHIFEVESIALRLIDGKYGSRITAKEITGIHIDLVPGDD